MIYAEMPEELYQTEQIKSIERLAIESGMDENALMEQAGAAAYQLLRTNWPEAEMVHVFCGSGNNAGDGYVLARLAQEDGLNVQVNAIKSINELTGAALVAATACQHAGTKITFLDANNEFALDFEADIIVDALLGTGLTGEVSDKYAAIIDLINNLNGAVLAIDVPSGINADTGAVSGNAILADATLTFIGLKQGLFTGDAKDCCGHIYCDDLNIPEAIFSEVDVNAFRIVQENALGFGRRDRNSHKGHFGHVLIIGGNYGMPGAVRLAAESALRVGAGLVSVATRPEHIAVISSSRPEIMITGVTEANEIDSLLNQATIIVLGPGLGQDTWAQALWQKAIQSDLPKIIDADALNLLAQQPKQSDNWVLTPHPGEASRLLNISSEAVQRDRFAACQQLQTVYGGNIILKGAGTLVNVIEDDAVYVCDKGNPGMASAGMGDVLSGVIAGIAAQNFPLEQAAESGVFLHAYAGDMAAEEGECGMLASDLIAYLRFVMNIDE